MPLPHLSPEILYLPIKGLEFVILSFRLSQSQEGQVAKDYARLPADPLGTARLHSAALMGKMRLWLGFRKIRLNPDTSLASL